MHFWGKAPAIGGRVKLEGLVKNNQVFLSRIEVSERSNEPTTVEGQFAGNNPTGTANIGGISVKLENNDNARLNPGDNVQLRGGTANGKLSVMAKESPRRETRNSTTLSGVLTAVDTSNGTITVKMAGNQVKVNISEAKIFSYGQSDRTLSLSEVSHLTGHDVKLDGLSKKNDLLFAGQVRIAAGN